MKEKKYDSGWIVIFSIVAILLIVLGGIFLSQFQREKAVYEQHHLTYNDYNFTRDASGAWTVWLYKYQQPYIMQTYYTPVDVESVSYDDNVTTYIHALAQDNDRLYIALDPDFPAIAVVAFAEIKKVLGDQYDLLNIDARAAYSRDDGYHYDLPILTCANATAEEPVLLMNVTDRNSIILDGDCVLVEAESYEALVLVADRLLFAVVGIM